MKLKSSYRFYSDAGHGWLAVPIREVRALDVKISRYSYRKGGTVYLEEDCDAPLFMKAYEKETGRKLIYKDIYHDHNDTGRSIIRSYHEEIPEDILESNKVKIATYNLYGEKGLQEIEGTFDRYDTCLFPFTRQNHEYEGTYEAEEVAKFCNDKIEKDGRFGFLFVKEEGTKITWYDDQPFNVAIIFEKKVED